MNVDDMVEVRPRPPTREDLWNLAGFVVEVIESDGTVLVSIPGGPGESLDNPPTYSFREEQLCVLYPAPAPKKPTLWNRIFWSHLLEKPKKGSK